MNSVTSGTRSLRGRLGRFFAVCMLLLLGALATVGPYGILSLGESNALLTDRKARMAQLIERRAELQNRVDLLDPDHADPDLVSELLRENLNVAHPDEYVMPYRAEP